MSKEFQREFQRTSNGFKWFQMVPNSSLHRAPSAKWFSPDLEFRAIQKQVGRTKKWAAKFGRPLWWMCRESREFLKVFQVSPASCSWPSSCDIHCVVPRSGSFRWTVCVINQLVISNANHRTRITVLRLLSTCLPLCLSLPLDTTLYHPLSSHIEFN